MAKNGLFDTDASPRTKKDPTPVERLKGLEDKISAAIEKVKSLKEENRLLKEEVRRLREENRSLQKRPEGLDSVLREKDLEISRLTAEKNGIREQVQELLSELESLEL